MVITAFITGIFANLHCIGMCGPLNSMFLAGRGNTAFFLYHTGRILIYSAFGLLAGLFGSAFHWAGLQQYVSIISGVAILLILFVVNQNSRFLFPTRWRNSIIKLFSSVRPMEYTWHYFLMGMLNGLLPCGIIYTALALAISAGDAGMGALTMVFFGLGTFPAFVLLKITSTRFKVYASFFRKANAYVTIVIACLLIIRGASLGIPYLSPKIDEQGVGCCTKK